MAHRVVVEDGHEVTSGGGSLFGAARITAP
jgi:hypothetical protein